MVRGLGVAVLLVALVAVAMGPVQAAPAGPAGGTPVGRTAQEAVLARALEGLEAGGFQQVAAGGPGLVSGSEAPVVVEDVDGDGSADLLTRSKADGAAGGVFRLRGGADGAVLWEKEALGQLVGARVLQRAGEDDAVLLASYTVEVQGDHAIGAAQVTAFDVVADVRAVALDGRQLWDRRHTSRVTTMRHGSAPVVHVRAWTGYPTVVAVEDLAGEGGQDVVLRFDDLQVDGSGSLSRFEVVRGGDGQRRCTTTALMDPTVAMTADLSGDALPDLVVVEHHQDSGLRRPRRVSTYAGVDCARRWEVAVDDRQRVDVLPAGDVTGDGAEDLVLAGVVDGTHRAALLDGASGAVRWDRANRAVHAPGGDVVAEVVEVAGDETVTYRLRGVDAAGAVRYDVPIATVAAARVHRFSVHPEAIGDVDADGAEDLWFFYEAGHFTWRSAVASGRSGAVLRDEPMAETPPRRAISLDGSGADSVALLWQPARLRATDGLTGALLWAVQLEQVAIGAVDWDAGDVDGDGTTEVAVGYADGHRLLLELLDGRTGAVLWRVPAGGVEAAPPGATVTAPFDTGRTSTWCPSAYDQVSSTFASVPPCTMTTDADAGSGSLSTAVAFDSGAGGTVPGPGRWPQATAWVRDRFVVPAGTTTVRATVEVVSSTADWAAALGWAHASGVVTLRAADDGATSGGSTATVPLASGYRGPLTLELPTSWSPRDQTLAVTVELQSQGILFGAEPSQAPLAAGRLSAAHQIRVVSLSATTDGEPVS